MLTDGVVVVGATIVGADAVADDLMAVERVVLPLCGRPTLLETQNLPIPRGACRPGRIRAGKSSTRAAETWNFHSRMHHLSPCFGVVQR